MIVANLYSLAIKDDHHLRLSSAQKWHSKCANAAQQCKTDKVITKTDRAIAKVTVLDKKH